MLRIERSQRTFGSCSRRGAAPHAIVAALVLLGLVIAVPARADLIWSATMTVGQWGNFGEGEGEIGWRPGRGALTSTEFDYDGVTHTFERIRDDQNASYPKVLFVSSPPDTFERYFHLRVTTPRIAAGTQQAFNGTRDTSSRAVKNRDFKFDTILASGHDSVWMNGHTVELAIIALPVQPRVTATGDDGAGVTLDWSGADAKHVESWQYRYSDAEATLGDAAWSAIAGNPATTTSHVVSVPLDTTYFFQVRAVNASGAGTPSNTVSNQGLNIHLPLEVPPVTTTAGAEVAALPVQLSVKGDDVAVTSFTMRGEVGGAGTLADIALVKAYRDANGNGQVDDGEPLLGEGALDEAGQITIGLSPNLTIAQGTPVNVVFAVQFLPTVSAAGGVGLVGALVAFAAARRRRGGAWPRGGARALAAALLALALVFVVGCEGVVDQPDKPRPEPHPEPQARTYQLTLTAIGAGDAPVILPTEGITGATVTIDGTTDR